MIVHQIIINQNKKSKINHEMNKSEKYSYGKEIFWITLVISMIFYFLVNFT